MLYLQNQSTVGGQGQGQGQGPGAGTRLAAPAQAGPLVADRLGHHPRAEAPSLASPARTPGSRFACTRARTGTTNGSSSEWKCRRRLEVARLAAPIGPDRNAEAGMAEEAGRESGFSGPDGRGGMGGGGSRGRGDQGGFGGRGSGGGSAQGSAITAALTSRRRATPAESAESRCSRAMDSRDWSETPRTPPRSGSIHNVVPVNPVWPNAEGDIFEPHEDVGSIVSHPSARDPVLRRTASRKAERFCTREPRIAARERTQNHSRDISNSLRRAE